MNEFSVGDFGAVGDGYVDDTPPVVAAIRACREAGGGTVTFEARAYRLGEQDE